jgi:hypothetical protein
VFFAKRRHPLVSRETHQGDLFSGKALTFQCDNLHLAASRGAQKVPILRATPWCDRWETSAHRGLGAVARRPRDSRSASLHPATPFLDVHLPSPAQGSIVVGVVSSCATGDPER